MHYPQFEFHTGPMGVGKTLELLVQAYKAEEEGLRVGCLQSHLNTRDQGFIRSRTDLKRQAHVIADDSREALLALFDGFDWIGVDEPHLFRPTIAEILLYAYRQKKHVVIAGIDTDYRGEMLETPRAILALPEAQIYRKPGICTKCGKRNAFRSERLRNGQPVSRTEPIVLVEGSQEGVTYETRCIQLHELLD